jgi:hypothetical protein
MMWILIIFAVIFVLAPIAQGYAKRLERPLGDPNALNEIARMREEIDRLTAQVARLDEEQQFMVRLLGEGERPALPPRRTAKPDRDPTD